MSARCLFLACLVLTSFSATPFFGARAFGQATAASRGADQQFAAAAGLHNRQAFDLAADEWNKFLKDYPEDKRISEARHYLGICLMQKQDYAGAAAILQKLVAADPKFEQIASSQLYLGLAQFNLGRAGKADQYPAAEKTLAELLAKVPEGKHAAQAWYYRGEAEYAQGKKKEAAASYQHFVAQHADDPLLPDALYALGVALDETGKKKEAEASYVDFLKRYPEHALTTDVGVRRAELLVDAGKPAEAEKLFAKAVADKAYEASDYALLRQAGCVYDRQDFPAATKLYDELAQRFPQSQYKDAATLAAGKSAYLAGDFPGVVARLTKSANGSGDAGAEAAHWTIRALLILDKAKEALALADAAVKNSGKTKFAAQVELDRADALYELDDRRADALAAYRDLAEKHAADPLAAQAQYLAAFTALEIGRNDDARKLADAFTKSYKQHALQSSVEYVAAEALLRDGKYDEAAKRYGELLKNYDDQTDRDLWMVRRATASSLAGKPDEVIKQLGKSADKLGTKELRAEARHLLGLSRQSGNDYQGAAADFQAALAADPKAKQADQTMLALAETQRLMGDAPAAQATLAKFLASFPESASRDTAEYRAAELAFAAGDTKAAEAAYRRVINDHPKSRLVPHAEHGLAWSLLSRQDAAGAADAADQLLKRKDVPEDVAAKGRYVRALARHRLKQYAPAIDDLEAYLKTKPKGKDRADALYVLGLCYEAVDKNDAAKTTFTTLLDSDPKYSGAPRVLYELGWVNKALKDEAAATASFARLAKDFPKDPLTAEALFHVGEAAYEKKDYAAAIDAYYDAREKADTDELGEKAAHKLGWTYFHRDNFKKAEEWFAFQQKQFPSGPLAQDAAFMEGEAAFKLGKFKEALAVYGRVQSPKNDDFQVLALLHGGQAAAQLQDYKQAQTFLDTAAAKFPKSPYLPEINYERAAALLNLGKDDDAMKLFESVTEQTDREIAARARFMVGEIYFNKKNHAEAVRHFFKAAYGYGYPEWQARAHFEAGRCFEVLGKPEQAKQSYQEVAEKYPQFEEAALAKKALARLGS